MERKVLLLLFLVLPVATVMAQKDITQGETLLPVEETGENSPEFQEWLRNMPSTIAPNPNGILEPVEPDFLKTVPLKPGQGMATLNFDLLKGPLLSPEEAQMLYWGKMLEEQRNEPGAMTIGVPVLAVAKYLLKKILPKDWLMSPRERHREKLQKILDEYDDTTHVSSVPGDPLLVNKKLAE